MDEDDEHEGEGAQRLAPEVGDQPIEALVLNHGAGNVFKDEEAEEGANEGA